MNELSVRQAIKKFVRDNMEKWVEGIVQSGYQRAISSYSLTRFTPPVQPYHINIACRRYSVEVDSDILPRMTRVRTLYDVSIELADYIYALPDEEFMYEQAVSDFLIVRDRIVQSIYQQASTYGYLDYSSYIFYFDVSNIDVSNVEELNVRGVPVMFSTVDFSLYSC